MKSNTLKATFFLLVLVLIGSCDSFRDTEYNDYKESPKDLEGVWQLKTVSRNGVDITEEMNFSQFKLNLKADGTYVLENYLPFAVKEDGQWRVDDPQYPFNLILREKSSNVDKTVALKYPFIDGKRIISITLSPGCKSNSYVYVFENTGNN